MRIEFTAEAWADVFEAADYYEGKEAGLGKRLRDEIARMLLTVASAPYLWRERRGGYRRVNCPASLITSLTLCGERFSWWWRWHTLAAGQDFGGIV